MITKIKSNKGGAMTILGLALIFFILITGMFFVDIAKNIYIKNVYYQYSQRATQTAIKSQNNVGGLSIESGQKAINEYLTQRNGDKIKTSEDKAFRGSCDTSQYPKITIKYDIERKAGVDDSKSITVDTSNGKTLDMNKYINMFNSNKYRVIEMNVTDVTGNFMLGLLGKPCSEINVTSSAISSSTFDSED